VAEFYWRYGARLDGVRIAERLTTRVAGECCVKLPYVVRRRSNTKRGGKLAAPPSGKLVRAERTGSVTYAKFKYEKVKIWVDSEYQESMQVCVYEESKKSSSSLNRKFSCSGRGVI
jgi:hypothetical protein